MGAPQRDVTIGAAAFIIAFAAAALGPPQPLIIGTTFTALLVPPLYQASVAPAFASFSLAALRGEFESRAPALALVGLNCALSVWRLLGGHPLSGHGLYLSSVLVFAAVSRKGLVHALFAGGGLAIVAFYKLFAWHDGRWFAWSLACGLAIGATTGFAQRRTASNRFT